MITKKPITIADLLAEIDRQLKKMKKKPEEVFLSQLNSYSCNNGEYEILASRDDGHIDGRSPAISITHTQ
jgi:hypothetical protein